MIVSQSATAVSGSFNDLWYTVIAYLPAIIAAVIVFLIGWIIAVILYRVVVEIVKVLRIGEALKSAGLNDAAKQAGFTLDVGKFLGTLVEWFVILVFLIASLEILGLTQVTIYLQTVVLLYLPQVIVASLILILGAIVAEIVKGLVSHSAQAAGSRSGNFAGTVAKWAIWITAIMAALTQLGIATALLQTLFTGVVIALSLAFGLAFGLGGRDAAADVIKKVRSDMSHHQM
jgi:Conserved TM helix